MSKNEMNNINNGSGSIIDKSSGNVNKITDKSKKITNNNTKIISKDKNAKKKNKHILPPQEKPTLLNGKVASKIDEPFSSLILKREINNISFI